MAFLRRGTPPFSSALLALLVSGCPALVSDPFRSGTVDDTNTGRGSAGGTTTGGRASGGATSGGARTGGGGPLGGGGTGATGGGSGGPSGGRWPTGGVGGEALGGDAGATVAPPLGGQGGSAPDPLLIDDLEDGDTFILPRQGRQGDWYMVNDQSLGGTQTWDVVSTDSHEGSSSLYSQAWGFTSWGAGVGLNLNASGIGKQSYDASAYTGISFWMRAGMYSVRDITMFVPDVHTDPEGGECQGEYCYDHFRATVAVTAGWAEYRLPFSMLRQEGFGTPRFAIDTAAIYGVEFRSLVNQNHEFWIDDVSFYE